jgi:glycerol-3-phosphate O-acyltransferase/dihydroxyacetone phosphate acyltransferase
MANDPSCQVKIVPVGLSYFHPHRFRSRAVVEFGQAIDVPTEWVEMFKHGGSEKRDAVSKFLDLIYDGLKTVTVRAPDYDTLMLIQAVRRLYKTPGQHLTLGQVVELNKRLLEGYHHFKDDPRIANLRKDVLNYNRLVRDLGLRDHQVPRAKKASWKTLGLLLYRILLLAVWAVLALPGTILNGPLFILASVLSRKKAKEALAASNVKVAGRDVLATWKILISLGGAPILYTVYAIVSFIVATKASLPIKRRVLTPFLMLVALPIMNYAALKFGEAGMDVLKSLRPLIIALVPGQQRSLDKLKAMRLHLSNEVSNVINEFGPKLYSDFNEWRILVPSASAPPSSGTPGIWRRKSATGGVDAQGLGLTHPFTWIDERVFGWSRSAKRGTSAWAGFMDESRVGTPDYTDDEDGGDYDDVITMIPSYDDLSSMTKPKSRQSSYADLQKLRMSAGRGSGTSLAVPNWSRPSISSSSPISPTTELDGIHFRHGQGHHARKASLSDGIAVSRIAAVERREPFEEATQELNSEADQKRHDGGKTE